jgi:proton-dependent oligopeptide transporter, POT family
MPNLNFLAVFCSALPNLNMTLSERLAPLRTGFTSLFWIANTLELFERLAFYGMKAVLVVFLIDKVGLEDGGYFAGTFTSLVYALPILAGVIVDRYGFKRTLSTCFAIFSVGYFLIGMAGMQWSADIVAAVGTRTYVLIVLIFTACGGSLIKPCIVGTVARTTTNENSRTLGFSIYYSLVNFGGAIGPVLAVFIREDLGIEYVLLMSSITCLLLFFGTLIFFREPDAVLNIEKRTFGKVFSDMVMVFFNWKFMLFLLICSGFWIMFWQIFYLLPVYATDVLKFNRFELLESVDAWFIIVFSLVSGTLFNKWKPFTALIFGFVVASLSWFVIGAFSTTLAAVVAVAIFAMGEGVQAPRYYEYINGLAPAGQTGTYSGFAFLPIAIGAFVAGILSDWLRLNFMATNPGMMWNILAAIGIVSTILLVMYDRILVQKKA